ncbi:adenylyltransferase/cytidyltransferase family protein [Lactococcus cremoris]
MLTNNISKSKLSGKNIGIYFGTFAPLHTGHQQQIYKCASLNDGVLLVVSGYDNDRGPKLVCPLKNVFYLRELLMMKKILKSRLNENDLPEMPNGWDEWANRLFELIHHNTLENDLSVTFYVGELEYAAELKKRFPADGNQYAVEIADRHDISLSATQIRENPQEHWTHINRVFRRHFSKVVTVMGSASGKNNSC